MDIRPSPLAGMWYPADPVQLRESIEEMLENEGMGLPAWTILGLVVPHAGHRYSGSVAARAFACLRKTPTTRVVVVSPWHHGLAGPLLTTGHDVYATPLGHVPVDREALEALDAEIQHRGGEAMTRVRRDREHAVEIELPFLQQVLPQFSLVPIMMGEQSEATSRRLGEALCAILGSPETVMVASSDLSHFHSAETAQRMDDAILEGVKTLDSRRLFAVEEGGRGEACGLGAIAAVMTAAKGRGAQSVKVLAHATSGDVTGDARSVVGYASAVMGKPEEGVDSGAAEGRPAERAARGAKGGEACP